MDGERKVRLDEGTTSFREALEMIERRIREAEEKTLNTPMVSPCTCGCWLHRADCEGPFLAFGGIHG